MDFESWWLIFLPLLFGLGWLSARYDLRHMMSESRTLPDSYFKGLNFLLNEQPDRAIDAFIEVTKLDTETTELHFALGNLFRRRGEMERAIRVHQSLLSRSDLPARNREHALHEIAQDYLKAGMLDRAEMAFQELSDTRYGKRAAKALVRIYETEHDWPRAIKAVQNLGKLTGESVPQAVHYHCELAELSLAKPKPDTETAMKEVRQAMDLIARDAQATQASKARVQMTLAQIAQANQDVLAQRTALLGVLEQAPGYAGLIASALVENFKQTNEQADLLVRLSTHYADYPSLDLLSVLFVLKREYEGSAAAWKFMREALRHNTSLLALNRALSLELPQQESSVEPSDEMIEKNPMTPDLVSQVIGPHTQRLDRYSCQTCGFQARQFYWQCPGCHSWETYRPLRLEELSGAKV